MAGSHRSRNVSAPRRASDVWVQPRLRNCLCHRSPARDRLLVLADEALRAIPPRTSCGRVKQVHWCTEAGGLRGDGVRRAEMMNSSEFGVLVGVRRLWLPRNILERSPTTRPRLI